MDSAQVGDIDRLGECRKQVVRMAGAKQISLGVADHNGHRPVVVVDEHARISDVLVQAARTDGYANLFVLTDDDSVLVADLLPSDAAGLPAVDITFNEPFERDIEIGMVFEVATGHPGGISFPIELPRQRGTFRSPRKLEDPALDEV